MAKKNKNGVVVEEVDVEALKAEAEDLIGAEESVDDKDWIDPSDVLDISKEKILLGFHPITKEKVYL